MVGADATGSVEQACLDAVDLIVTVALRRNLKRFDLFELCTRCVYTFVGFHGVCCIDGQKMCLVGKTRADMPKFTDLVRMADLLDVSAMLHASTRFGVRTPHGTGVCQTHRVPG